MASKIESLRLEPADNGFTICWTECIRNETSGTYGNTEYTPHEEVFKDNDAKKAMARFMELRNEMKNIKEVKEENE